MAQDSPYGSWREIVSSGIESHSGSRNKNVFRTQLLQTSKAHEFALAITFWEFVF